MESADLLFLLSAAQFDLDRIERWSDEAVFGREKKLERVLQRIEYLLLIIRHERLRRELAQLDSGSQASRETFNDNGTHCRDLLRGSKVSEPASDSTSSGYSSSKMYSTQTSPSVCFLPNPRLASKFERLLSSRTSDKEPEGPQYDNPMPLLEDMKEDLEDESFEQDGKRPPPTPPPGKPSSVYTRDPINGQVYEIVTLGSGLCLTTTGVMKTDDTRYLFGEELTSGQLVWVENFLSMGSF